MTLQEQILARICATPHRPPTHRDIIQALYPEPYLTIGAEIKAMLSAGIIDTENGDSGLTYTLKKSAHVPVEIPRTVTVCDHAGIAYFPSKKPNAQNRWRPQNASPLQPRMEVPELLPRS